MSELSCYIETSCQITCLLYTSLAGLSVAQVLQMPADVACGFARKTGAVTVLKGHRTLVAAPGGRLYRNTTGNAGLARGGSGDLLAGMVAGLAAQGLSPEAAAV